MRFLSALCAVTLLAMLPVSAQEKQQPPQSSPPPKFETVDETFTVDITVDDMEQKLIERGKSCATTALTPWTRRSCRTEVLNIFSTRAMMKFTCLQVAGGIEPPLPNSPEGKLAKACSEMVTSMDNFLHEVYGVSRDSPAKPQ